jgi:hypothetical protein
MAADGPAFGLSLFRGGGDFGLKRLLGGFLLQRTGHHHFRFIAAIFTFANLGLFNFAHVFPPFGWE